MTTKKDFKFVLDERTTISQQIAGELVNASIGVLGRVHSSLQAPSSEFSYEAGDSEAIGVWEMSLGFRSLQICFFAKSKSVITPAVAVWGDKFPVLLEIASETQRLQEFSYGFSKMLTSVREKVKTFPGMVGIEGYWFITDWLTVERRRV